MKVESLSVNGLYGYMNLNVKFSPDMNFLIGINGSGKTSALNVISWVLTPSCAKLSQVDFNKIEVVCRQEPGILKTVRATKEKGKVLLSVSGIKPNLEIPIFQYTNDLPMERVNTNIGEMYERFAMESKAHPVWQALEAMGGTLFLPLNRRWETPERDIRPRPRTLRYRPSPGPAGPVEAVLYFAERYYRERQFDVSELSEKLREDLVEYSFGEIVSMADLNLGAKSWKVEEIRKRRDKVIQGLSQANIHISDKVISNYFARLERLATKLEKEKSSPGARQTARVEWAMNMPQVQKIERVIQRMEEFNRAKEDLLKRIEDFLTTVNSFLCDTGKMVSFDTSGEIVIHIDAGHEIRSESLSSGEGQLVVLFTYLYFGFPPKREFVVMIDEPELSLHLNWQHRYVESVFKANPNAQFIFATHAPEIAQGHRSQCIELSPKGAEANAGV